MRALTRSTRSTPTTGPISTALDEVRAAAAPLLPLPALDGAAYARSHALFEARSDQRALLTAWLTRRLAVRAAGPSRVLSVGAGDGVVDAAVAAVLAGRGQPVRYDAVEPHGPSARAWLRRLRAVPAVAAGVQVAAFDEVRLPAGLVPRDPAGLVPREPHGAPGAYDAVLFVHSLYYVPDVRAALRRSYALLAPGGELAVLHAPSEALNELVVALAPRPDGHPQWFSKDVADALAAEGLAAVRERLPARLDLSPTRDAEADAQVLDFAVQAVLPAVLRPPVLRHLAAARLPGPGLVVPHPLDAFVVRRPVVAG